VCLGGDALSRPNSLSQVAPDWVRAQAPPAWYERYARRPEGFRLSEQQRRELSEQIGADGYALLDAIYATTAPAALRDLPAVEPLRRIWVQQFCPEQGAARWRESPNHPPGKLMIYSPYDTEARLGQEAGAGVAGR